MSGGLIALSQTRSVAPASEQPEKEAAREREGEESSESIIGSGGGDIEVRGQAANTTAKGNDSADSASSESGSGSDSGSDSPAFSANGTGPKEQPTPSSKPRPKHAGEMGTTPAMVEAMVTDSSICPRVCAEEAKEQIARAWQNRQMPPDDDFFIELLTANNGSNHDPYARHRRRSGSGSRRLNEHTAQNIVKARNSFVKDSDKAWIYRAIRSIIALECIRHEGYAKPVGPEVLDEDDVLLEKRAHKREHSILRVFNVETAGEDTPPKVTNADFCKKIDVAERRLRMLMAVTMSQLEKQKQLAGLGCARARSSSVAHTINSFVDRAALDLNRPLPLASMAQAELPYVAHGLAQFKSLLLASPRAAGYYEQAMKALPGNEALRKSFEQNVPARIREAQEEQKKKEQQQRQQQVGGTGSRVKGAGKHRVGGRRRRK